MSKYSVPDMSCGHCRASIQEAFQPFAVKVKFDVERREIEVADLAPEKVLTTLEAIGFPAAEK